MCEAREVMDRVTDVVMSGDEEALKGLCAPTRSLRRQIRGRDAIAA